MNQHDLLAAPMTDAFQNTANLVPFTAIPNQIPLNTMNPAATTRLQKAWRNELAKFFPQGPDQQPDVADPNLLNHAIWYATKGFSTPYPGERRVLNPKQLKPSAADPDDH